MAVQGRRSMTSGYGRARVVHGESSWRMSRAAPRPTEAFALRDWRVDDCRGHRVGTVAAVYAVPDAGAPAWYLVRLGRYSTRFVLVPPADVLSWHGRISLPWDRLLIERAPLLYTVPGVVTEAMERDLRRHFRLAEVAGVRMIARRPIA